MHYFTPCTPDGSITSIQFESPSRFTCTARFEVPDSLRHRFDSGATPVFAARSRICRLGISVTPLAAPVITGNHMDLLLAGRAVIPDYQLDSILESCLVPGVGIGRIIACDPAWLCGAGELHESLKRRELLLPRGYSLMADGVVEFSPQFCRYEFPTPVNRDQLFAIINRQYGKELLNTLQTRTSVDSLILKPGEGIITSCSMFLHRHFLVLDTHTRASAAHLSARILDPVETRLSKVFLEFENTTDAIVVNPRASARVYRADQREYPVRTFVAVGSIPSNEQGLHSFEQIEALFSSARRLSGNTPGRIVCEAGDAPYAVSEIASSLSTGGGGARCVLHAPRHALRRDPAAMRRRARDLASTQRLPTDRPIVLFSEYFPDTVEYPELLSAAAAGNLKSLVFRQASAERGPFFSERDHIRMGDLADFGTEIYWANPQLRHVARLTHKERRAFFVPEDKVDSFQDALIMAVYGSVMDLSDIDQDRLARLLGRFKELFGDSLAFLTGGGGGVMKHVSEMGAALNLMVGSNYLENADQNIEPGIGFYQMFQGGSRHMRQRWFEVGRFHLFCIGGLGTLEEIGLTLTDIKLGLLNREPIVFFGRETADLYWRDLQSQMARMVEAGRAPRWITDNLLVTDNPDDAIAFYQRILQIA
jgi:predicted Rossmann-fold nucleotide-binding protein